jgi:CHAD domain-containing protein
MGVGIEREVKLGAPADFVLPDLTGVLDGAVVSVLAPRHLRAVYWDTVDLRLARAGVSLRHRVDDGGGDCWTVKLPVDAGERAVLSRREIDIEGPASQVPPGAERLVRAYARQASLEPVAQLDSRRIRLQLRDRRGRPVAEIDDDEVAVVDGGRVTQRFREVEVELADHAPASVSRAVVARLVEAGAREADPLPKVGRALGEGARGPGELEVDPLDSDSTAGDLVRAALASGAGRLVRHDPGVRLGEDPEEVHQARVATRRLRSDLRTLSSLLDPGWAGRLRTELGWVGEALGRVRDADVLMQRLWGHAAGLDDEDVAAAGGLLELLAATRAQARADLVAVMDSPRYLGLLDALVDAVKHPALSEAAGYSAAYVAPALVSSSWRRLERCVSALSEAPSEADLHRVRILAKRCRYASDVAALVAGRPARRLGRRLADLQDVLGEIQDTVVAEEWLRRAASGPLPVEQAVVVGELIAAERTARQAARSRWPKVWARAARPGLRRWIR